MNYFYYLIVMIFSGISVIKIVFILKNRKEIQLSKLGITICYLDFIVSLGLYSITAILGLNKVLATILLILTYIPIISKIIFFFCEPSGSLIPEERRNDESICKM